MQPHYDSHTADIIAIDILHQQLPELQALQRKMHKGKRLNDMDMQHLAGMLHETHDSLAHIQHHQKYAGIMLDVIHRYQELIQQTLDEELTENNAPGARSTPR